MFVLFFAICIFLGTVFENICIIIGGFLLCATILVVMRNYKQIGFCALAFLLATLAIWVYNVRQPLNPLSSVFLGTGQILDRQGQGKYLLSDGDSTYLLASQNDYQPGGEIRLAGNIKMTDDQFKKGSFLVIPSSKMLSGLLHYEFNYDKRLKMKGIQGTIFEQNAIQLKNFDGKNGFISSLRIGLQSMVYASYGKNKTAGLVLGMLIGDKSEIPKSDYQSFIDSGLVHLIAVSGGNVIMIVVFLSFILLRLPFYVRNFVILVSVIIYGFLCGMDSSVLRAVIMGGLGMVALFRGRQLDIRRALSFAFLGMLIVNPYYLAYDVGFLFSFSAIIGLIYFSKIGQDSESDSVTKNSLPAKTPMPQLLQKIKIGISYARKSYLSPSVGATLGILPTMIFFMGKINFMGILGNLFVLPVVPIVMIYGFISTLIYQIFPWSGFIRPEEQLIHYIYRVSNQVGNFGFYMNVEGDRIKYLLLATAILRFIIKKLKSPKTQEKKPFPEMEKAQAKRHEFTHSHF